ncbi:fungal hydrophobin [Ganoderma leucocontextum]|nr:fungal hydrophobin [Ganoderma leucocontextum]
MIAHVAAVAAFFAFPLLALAGGADCNTGDIQCCNSFEDANSTAGSALLAALGINVQDVTGQIGLQCNPVTVIGGQITSQCSQQPVCCQNNNVGGAVSVGCIPVQL